MPRNRSEASSQLELYQMATEKERIQRELHFINERMGVLKQRLNTLNHQIEETEKAVKKMRAADARETENSISPHANQDFHSVESKNYHILEIEY
ncbi:hypothetical protein [Umezakia ovalisporum]|jgi:cell division septum initiation protein DivIVA